MIRLDVPYRSQRGPDAPGRNDCGPACVAMVAGVDVVTALAACGPKPGRPASILQLIQGARRLGRESRYYRPLLPYDLVDALVAGSPSIVLVGYSHVPSELKQDQEFQGAHFVVVVGYDPEADVFFVHDPNFDGEAGAGLVWPYQVLFVAMGAPGWGNQPYQGIVFDPPGTGDEEE